MKSFGSAVAVLVLLLGGVALGVLAVVAARSTRATRRSPPAASMRALASYARAEERFDKIPAAKQLFAADYDHAVANELSARYRLGRFDEVIERAEHAPDAAAPHFWSGCAFFRESDRRGEARRAASAGSAARKTSCTKPSKRRQTTGIRSTTSS